MLVGVLVVADVEFVAELVLVDLLAGGLLNIATRATINTMTTTSDPKNFFINLLSYFVVPKHYTLDD